jgi:hypothetical protein
LAEKLSVGDDATITCIVCLVDDGGFVRIFERVTVDAVVAGVQPAFEKPGIVTSFEAASVYGLKIAIPREQLARKTSPKLLGLCNGLLVQLLVLLEAIDVWF